MALLSALLVGVALIAAILFTVGGASGARAADLLAGSEWRPVEIRGAAVDGNDARYVRFGAEGKVTGSGGCNRFFGTAKIEGTRLTLAPLASTRKACPPPLMSAERAFLDTLEAAHSFERNRARLDLRDAGGTTIMRLAQTDWD